MIATAATRKRAWSPRIWAWIAGSILALTLAFPRHDRWFEICDVCASRQHRSQVSFAWGLLSWGDSEIDDSTLVDDDIVESAHAHRWSNLSHSWSYLLGRGIGCGGARVSEFARLYAVEPDFRQEVQARLVQGALKIDQIRRELDQDWTRPNDPDRAPIEQLLREFDRPPRQIR